MDLGRQRKAKDDHFRNAHDSPLTHEQREHFGGLRYFEPDASFRFEVKLEPATATAAAEEVEMSDGTTDRLERAGTLRFSVDGTEVTLLAYRQGHDLFVPFRDATSGSETYGAGRYVEAGPLGGGRFLLDFNTAYNPYCAYNDNWRCPLPPRENWLRVAIRAGEKSFH